MVLKEKKKKTTCVKSGVTEQTFALSKIRFLKIREYKMAELHLSLIHISEPTRPKR